MADVIFVSPNRSRRCASAPVQAPPPVVRRYIPGAVYPELPAGFAAQHSPESSKAESPQGYLKKDEYIALFEKTRAATLATLNKLTDADLDKPGPERFRKMMPTVGHIVILIATHGLMHAGQFTVLRRKLGKPVLF